MSYTHVKQYSELLTSRKGAYPLVLKCSMILETASIGTEKLSPSAAKTFIMLTPITSPSMLTRGPPELPWTKKISYKGKFVLFNYKISYFLNRMYDTNVKIRV